MLDMAENNSVEDDSTVIICVDQSQQAEYAFTCKFIAVYVVVNEFYDINLT